MVQEELGSTASIGPCLERREWEGARRMLKALHVSTPSSSCIESKSCALSVPRTALQPSRIVKHLSCCRGVKQHVVSILNVARMVGAAVNKPGHALVQHRRHASCTLRAAHSMQSLASIVTGGVQAHTAYRCQSNIHNPSVLLILVLSDPQTPCAQRHLKQTAACSSLLCLTSHWSWSRSQSATCERVNVHLTEGFWARTIHTGCRGCCELPHLC